MNYNFNTVDYLLKHHGGEDFKHLMLITEKDRFSNKFWKYFHKHIGVYLNENSKIADFGAGTGSFIKEFVKRYKYKEIHAIEIMDYMLIELHKLKVKNLYIHKIDLHNQNNLNQSFDAAILSFIIHELIDPINMLKLLKKVLKPKAKAVVLDWIRMPLKKYITLDYDENFVFNELEYDKRIKLFRHFMEHNKYTPNDLIYLFKKIGFKVLNIEKYDNRKHIRAIITPK
ncbi:MAG: class I SAM-dependent methyltransferase [bacterium]|nr:class I SAM-dependent methyltransferase [bacterium]